MADTDKMASAGGTAKARSYDGGEGLNLRQHTSANTGNSKADDAADRDKECGGKNLLDAGLQAAKRGWCIEAAPGSRRIARRHSGKTFQVSASASAIGRSRTSGRSARHWGPLVRHREGPHRAVPKL